MRRSSRADARTDLAMLAVVLIWASSNVYIKAALAEIAPLAYVLGRYLIVLALLVPWLLVRGGLVLPAVADWPLLLLAGVAGYGVYNALFVGGLAHTSAFAVALLLSLSPVFTLLIATLLGTERTATRQWLGAALATAGVVLFVTGQLGAAIPSLAVGDGLTLLAAIAFAVYSLATRPLVGIYGAGAVTAWSILIGMLVSAPLTLPAALQQDWRAVSGAAWLSLLAASVVSLLVAYNLWAWALARGGVARAVPYLFVMPVLTGIFSAIWLGEQFGPIQLAGAAAVLVGTAVVRLAARHPSPERGPPPRPETASRRAAIRHAVVSTTTPSCRPKGEISPRLPRATTARDSSLRSE